MEWIDSNGRGGYGSIAAALRFSGSLQSRMGNGTTGSARKHMGWFVVSPPCGIVTYSEGSLSGAGWCSEVAFPFDRAIDAGAQKIHHEIRKRNRGANAIKIAARSGYG